MSIDPTSPVRRMGFALDIVRYSGRSEAEQVQLQHRLAEVVNDVLNDLGVRLADTDHQGTGDGMMIFLPTTVHAHKALPRLLQSLPERLAHNNGHFADRMRLRLAVAEGPIGLSALGFAGGSVVAVYRLLGSGVLRQAMTDYPDADVAALISDKLYSDFISPRQSRLEAAYFSRKQVHVNNFPAGAWLCIAR